MTFDKNAYWEHVLPEDYLELSNGKIVRSIGDLIISLREMDKDSFDIHVYKSNNDFSEWIRDAYGNDKLAKTISKTRRKAKIIKILEKELKIITPKKDMKIKSPKKKKDILKILRGVGDA